MVGGDLPSGLARMRVDNLLAGSKPVSATRPLLLRIEADFVTLSHVGRVQPDPYTLSWALTIAHCRTRPSPGTQ